MALEYIPEPNALLTCPYDESHSIRAFRFSKHLVKCGRNRAVKFVMCPFNANHLIKPEERNAHIAACPDDITVKRQIDAMTASTLTGDLTVPSYKNVCVFTSGEHWELDDTSTMCYDPSEAMSRAQFYNPSTLSSMMPSEKRAFRERLHRNWSSRQSGVDDANFSAVADDLMSMRLPRPRLTSVDIERPSSLASSMISLNIGHQSPQTTEEYLPHLERLSSLSTYVGPYNGVGRGSRLSAFDDKGLSDIERPPSVVSACSSMSLGLGRGWDPSDADDLSSDIERQSSVASSYAPSYVSVGRGRPRQVAEEGPNRPASVQSASYTPMPIRKDRSVAADDRPQSVASSIASSHRNIGRGMQFSVRQRTPSVCSSTSSTLWGMGRGRPLMESEQSTDGSVYEDALSESPTLSDGSLDAGFQDYRDPDDRKSDRSSVCSLHTAEETIDRNRDGEMDVIRQLFAGLCLQIDPESFCSPLLIQYITDHLSSMQLDKDTSSYYESNPIQYIVEQLSHIQLSDKLSQYEPLMQSIINRLSAISIDSEAHRREDFQVFAEPH